MKFTVIYKNNVGNTYSIHEERKFLALIMLQNHPENGNDILKIEISENSDINQELVDGIATEYKIQIIYGTRYQSTTVKLLQSYDDWKLIDIELQRIKEIIGQM